MAALVESSGRGHAPAGCSTDPVFLAQAAATRPRIASARRYLEVIGSTPVRVLRVLANRCPNLDLRSDRQFYQREKRLSFTGGSNMLNLVCLERLCAALNMHRSREPNRVTDVFGQIG